jgi:hypothetical protein
MKRLRTGLGALAFGLLTCPSAEAAGCADERHSLLVPFVGDWQELTETEDGEHLQGTLRFAYILDGCAIRQTFTAAGSGFRFETLGQFDPAKGRWVETYVFNDGRSASYEWIPDGDDWFQYPLDPQRRQQKRLRITEIRADSYLVVEEHSPDSGATWSPVERTRTRRIP